MLKITEFEFITRAIPEVFIFLFATYAFSKTKLDFKKYIFSVVLLAISVFIIRMLPINYGVHTIINILVQTVIVITICKINILSAIKAAIMTTMTMFLCEGINVVLLNLMFRDDLALIFQDPKLKVLYGLPSLILLSIIVVLYYFYNEKKEKLKNV